MNKLDRYIIRAFFSTLVFSIAALCVIFLVVNLMESLDDFIDKKANISVIARYYLNFFPEIIKLLTPIAMLLASLFSVGRLTNLNEITAMKSGGLSLYRMMFPLLALSLLLSFGQLYFNGWIVPIATQNKFAIEREFLQRSVGGVQSFVSNLNFRDTPLRNVLIGTYDSQTKTGQNWTVEEYTNEVSPRIKRRIDALRVDWDSTRKKWLFTNGFTRDFEGTTVAVTRFSELPIELAVQHQSITKIQRSTEEMNLDELREYIELVELGGKDVSMKMIDYYGQYAFPFANFIVVLFGVPFASVKKKSGIAVEIATAMVVCFMYLVFTKLSQSIGFELGLDPILVGWSANAVFLVVGVINLLRIQK